jgi:serine/threonine protein kinase
MLYNFIHPKDLSIIYCNAPEFLEKSFEKFKKTECEKSFRDANFMYSLSCYMQWLIYSSSHVKYDTPKHLIPLLVSEQCEKIQNKKQTIMGGVSGDIFKSLFAYKYPIIIKYKSLWSSMTDFLHEYQIGMMGTNKLRIACPNFCYTLAIYHNPNCVTEKVLRQQKQVSVKVCRTNRLVLEYIPGITFKDYLKKIMVLPRNEVNINGFLKIFIQIILSLEISQQSLFFTHHDLHYNNIMIMPNKSKNTCNYQVFDQVYQIQSSNTPIIIDFGHASIIDGNQILGKAYHNSFADIGLFPFYLPGADLYKVIGSIWFEFFHKLQKDGKRMPYKYSANTMGSVLTKFFQFILDNFYNIQTWSPQNANYINIKLLARPDILGTEQVYLSTFSFLDFLNKTQDSILTLFDLEHYPWTQLPIQDLQQGQIRASQTSLKKILVSCYEYLTCSRLKQGGDLKNVFENTWNEEPILNNDPAFKIIQRVFTPDGFTSLPIPKLNLENLDTLTTYLGDLQDWEEFVNYMNKIFTHLQLHKPLPSDVWDYYIHSKTNLIYFYRVYICIKSFFSYVVEFFKIPLLKN